MTTPTSRTTRGTKITIAIAAWLIGLVLALRFNDGFSVVAGMFLLAGMASILSLCVSGVISLVWKRHGALRFSLASTAFFLSLIFVLAVCIRWQIHRAVSQSTQLLTAIEDFRAAQRRYPNDLSELVPEHIAAIPSVTIGLRERGYGYRHDEAGESFAMFFQTYGLSTMTYRSDTRAWKQDD